MSTLTTPSAKAHERVTGRWVRDIKVDSKLEWFVYYSKMIVGSSVPFLMLAYAMVAFISRAGVEIAAWAAAALTVIYIALDRFGRTREFSFFRIGADFFVLGLVLVAVITAATSDNFSDALGSIGDLRWVVLLYAISYCWELFPGINRVFFCMIAGAVAAASYGLWQHFTGVDLLREAALLDAPSPRGPYFIPTGFFGTTEVFGTVLAMVLPFPVAAFLLTDPRDSLRDRYLPMAIAFILILAIFWTYHPGIWLAASTGFVVSLLMLGKQGFKFVMTVLAFLLVTTFVIHGSPTELFEKVEVAQNRRAEKQREQINAQVALWEQNNWVGVGHKATEAATYDPSTGNAYFFVLAKSGVLGATFYLLFLLAFLLSTYRVFQEIPRTHYWHRTLIAGALGAQLAFHVAGLYWVTLAEAIVVNLFVLILSSFSYLTEHYGRGLVSDDISL
jgi:hypothetical protein